MFRRTSSALIKAVLAVAMFVAAPASASTLTYDVQDLADVVPGTDLWRYTYTLSDVTLNADQGLQVFFDYSATSGLGNATPDVSDLTWDVLLLDPDVLLTADGVFDALSLGTHASPLSFSVDFAWSGSGAPGVQGFALYDLVGDQVVVFEEGRTSRATTSIPEPGACLLLAASVLAVVRSQHSKKR